jgi:hypothetical protein
MHRRVAGLLSDEAWEGRRPRRWSRGMEGRRVRRQTEAWKAWRAGRRMDGEFVG